MGISKCILLYLAVVNYVKLTTDEAGRGRYHRDSTPVLRTELRRDEGGVSQDGVDGSSQ